MLLTHISDKFSNSSSVFLSINTRLGAGVSKDSLKRFISNKCSDLEKSNKFLSSSNFTLASFDNVDKNSDYSIVGIGRDKGGFHGTTVTVQTVVPCPSVIVESDLTRDNVEILSPKKVSLSRDRAISQDLIDCYKPPE
jgi:hypothetical protein